MCLSGAICGSKVGRGCDQLFLYPRLYWCQDENGEAVITQVYIDLVMVLNFFVDFLLLMAANALAGMPKQAGRCTLAAVLGALYAGGCMLPGLRFLGNYLWRIVFLLLMAAIAYGISRSALRRGILFVLLSMALGGIAIGIGSGSFASLILGALLVCAMCVLGFRYRPGSRSYIPVELAYAGRQTKLIALQDTGNTLKDPVTGQSVLIVSADVAKILLGLSKLQLASPVETMASQCFPGLRLIPYHAVGKDSGMLLAMRLDHVRIGAKTGSRLVAFAPEGLDSEGMFQALTGGEL